MHVQAYIDRHSRPSSTWSLAAASVGGSEGGGDRDRRRSSRFGSRRRKSVAKFRSLLFFVFCFLFFGVICVFIYIFLLFFGAFDFYF
jgi:hypothetical protein